MSFMYNQLNDRFDQLSMLDEDLELREPRTSQYSPSFGKGAFLILIFFNCWEMLKINLRGTNDRVQCCGKNCTHIVRGGVQFPRLRSGPKLVYDQTQLSAHPCVPRPKLQGLDGSSSALKSG